MALIHDLSQVPKEAQKEDLTEALIWLTMGVGIPLILEDTADEFYIRTAVYERLFGAFRTTKGGHAQFITPKEVRSYIGLQSNATPFGRQEFMVRITNILIEDAIMALERFKAMERKEDK